MRLLVTGGLGVNGAWVVRSLLAQGHEVAVLENRPDTSLIDDVTDRVELFVGDLCRDEDVHRALSAYRPEVIVHLAAFVDCERFPADAITVNVGGTARLCAAANRYGVRRVVYTSTKGVYKPATGTYGHPEYAPITEEYDREPTTMYGISKLAGEKVLEWYVSTTPLEAVSLRFATIFGPGRLQRHAGPISTYSALIELPARGDSFLLDHGGDERDGVLYVLDVADAITRAALAPGPPRHFVYNVAGDEPVSLNDFAAAVRARVPGAEIEIGPGLNPMDYMPGSPYYMNIEDHRFREEFGWGHRFDLEQAVAHYYEQVKVETS